MEQVFKKMLSFLFTVMFKPLPLHQQRSPLPCQANKLSCVKSRFSKIANDCVHFGLWGLSYDTSRLFLEADQFAPFHLEV